MLRQLEEKWRLRGNENPAATVTWITSDCKRSEKEKSHRPALVAWLNATGTNPCSPFFLNPHPPQSFLPAKV